MNALRDRPSSWSPLSTAGRLVVAAFCWLTAAYAFVASSPFGYQQFLRPRVFRWVGAFSDWHVVGYWGWLALATVGIWRDRVNSPVAKRLAIGFIMIWTSVGIWLLFDPILPRLADNHASVWAGLIALLPLLWLAAIDYVATAAFLMRQRIPPTETDQRNTEVRLLVAVGTSAMFVTALYAVLTPLSMAGHFEPDLGTAGLSVGLARSTVDHLFIFCGSFLIIAVTGRLVRRASFPTQYATYMTVFIVALSIVVQRTIGDAVDLGGTWGATASATVAASIIVTWGALRLRRWSRRETALGSALDAFFGPLPVRLGPRQLGSLAMVVVVAYALGRAASFIDWDFALLKAGVLIVWVVALDQVYRVTPGRTIGRVSLVGVVAICLTPLAAQRAARALDSAMVQTDTGPLTVRHMLDRYTVYNPSFRVAHGLLADTRSDVPEFDRYLRANSGLYGLTVSPVNIDFVPELGPSALEPKPFVFLFIIDSLRPDYLQPYNAAVSFTPRLAEFGADSFVFRNAFTRYGATGLSVPAIWMGAVGAHKQYVLPFEPMNALDKLLEANRYERVLSLDSIMQQLLSRSSSLVELDRGRSTMDYEFCRTLEELESRLDVDPTPLFAYTLPQDLHIGNIRTGSVPGDESYPGFFGPYAARVHRIDACFGRFIDLLRQRGIYDRSIIIVTSDHGDLLGEDGRWGHGYYLFPEVIQIPLVIHLPPAIAHGVTVDRAAVSFSIDITPTLYAALGYRPQRTSRLMGEPLVLRNGESAVARRRDTYVLASSYGAVYAVLRQNGSRLYIIDAIKGQDYAYDRAPTGQWSRVDVSEGWREANQRLIREHIDEIAREYRVSPPTTP